MTPRSRTKKVGRAQKHNPPQKKEVPLPPNSRTDMTINVITGGSEISVVTRLSRRKRQQSLERKVINMENYELIEMAEPVSFEDSNLEGTK